MKYAIFYLIKGKAEIYYKNIIKNIAKISGEKYLIDNPLPSHITLKYTFDADKKQIKELEKIIGLFVKRQKKSKINIDGFNNFNKFVVYMDVKFSMEAKYVRNNLIKQLSFLLFGTFLVYMGVRIFKLRKVSVEQDRLTKGIKVKTIDMGFD